MFERWFGRAEGSVLIREAFEDVSTMLQQSGRMLDLAVGALLENKDLDSDLDALDDVVDEGERRVRRLVLEHLSVRPEQDLVSSLVLVSMVQDAERIGDFARGLGELVPLARSPREGRFADELLEAFAVLRPLFELTETAFLKGDRESAGKVVSSHRALKKRFHAYTVEIAASDLSPDMAVVYSGAARILRRIGAHLSNLCSSVVQPYDRIRHGDEEV